MQYLFDDDHDNEVEGTRVEVIALLDSGDSMLAIVRAGCHDVVIISCCAPGQFWVEGNPDPVVGGENAVRCAEETMEARPFR